MSARNEECPQGGSTHRPDEPCVWCQEAREYAELHFSLTGVWLDPATLDLSDEDDQ